MNLRGMNAGTSGRRWAILAAALLTTAAAAFLATPRAAMLVVLVAWHAGLILLPLAAIVFGCLNAGVRDLAVLALYGLAGSGIAAFALFWLWWASPSAGALASIGAIALGAAAIAWFLPRLDRSTLSHVSPLGGAALAWMAYALLVLAFGLAPSGFQSPVEAVRQRFTPELSLDHVLPWIFAHQISVDHVLSPMAGSWLSSDRPPLQAAYFLASFAPLLPHSDVHYQVQGTLLQALWLPCTWVLLASFGLARGAVFLALSATMFSGFALANTLYVWPKLLPVAFLAVACAVLLNATQETLSDARVGAAAGACCALAMLGHASSAFFILGLGVALVAMRRIPPMRFLAPAAATAFAVALPWMLYQKLVDPPGNRLLKWHLAGVELVDSRSFAEAVRDSYAALPPQDFLRNKLANLEAVMGPATSAGLVLKASTVGLDDHEASDLRTWQFFHVASALGVLAFAPLAWLVPGSRRRREGAASLRLFAVALASLVVWIGLMFEPGGTIIHAGSLAVICFLMTAGMLAFHAASPWLGCAALALHAALTLDVYARAKPLAAGASIADYRAFVALALVALVVTCVSTWKLSTVPDRSSVQT